MDLDERRGVEKTRIRWAGNEIDRASPVDCAADNCGLHESGRGRASPAWIAGHEVPPTSPVGVSKVDGNRLTAFFECAFCFDVAVEWSTLLYLLCRAFDRLIGRG